MTEGLVLGPALALGILIGLYEVLIIHRDVTVGARKFGHATHAFLLSIAFTFCTMNTAFVLSISPPLQNIPVLGTQLGLNIALGVLAAVKIHGVSRATRTNVGTTAGLAETWFHSLLIGGLIAAAPYIYPFIEPALPGWINW